MSEQPLQNSLFEDDYLLRELGQAILTDGKSAPDSVLNPGLKTAGGKPAVERT
ncbi:MAG: hypothetical protein MUC77_11820 [Chromatiaceae bacterium]|jgi:hypothetical protein|nr:hypothetical protein [Chromatiaceae bacterium]